MRRRLPPPRAPPAQPALATRPDPRSVLSVLPISVPRRQPMAEDSLPRPIELIVGSQRKEVPVTRLRKTMLEELERRNFSQSTTRSYIRTVEDFARHFHRSPDQLGPQHVREYQAYLFTKRKLAANTVILHLAALRFFFVKTLRKPWSIADTPYPKKTFRLPLILSQEEVAQLIDAAETSFHRMLLMTAYASGLRRAELANLKIMDVDSRRMLIHVKGGKGRKDRDVMLSPKLLEELRAYWRGLP